MKVMEALPQHQHTKCHIIIHSVTSSHKVSHQHTKCHIIIHSVTSSVCRQRWRWWKSCPRYKFSSLTI